MNRAERRRQSKQAEKKVTYNVTASQLQTQIEKAVNEGRREGLEWLRVVMLTVLEDHFEFTGGDIARLKELVNFRIKCMDDVEHTQLTHNDLKEQVLGMPVTRAEYIRALTAEEMAVYITNMIPKFIRKDKRKHIVDYLMDVQEK